MVVGLILAVLALQLTGCSDNTTGPRGDTNTPRLCINNLRMIQSAKERWAEQNKKPVTATPTAEDITPLIKNGFAECKCEKGGTYSIRAVGQEAECSLHGTASNFRKQ